MQAVRSESVKALHKLRAVAKTIGPLYWLAGLMRYVAFMIRLRRETRRYFPDCNVLPPPKLRYRVHGALDEDSYVAVGKRVAKDIFDVAYGHGTRWNGLAVLDFACGPGRVATELKNLAPGCSFEGSDIDREAITWAQEHLPKVGAFQVNKEMPPTNYLDGQFDIIYSVSLFTHLDETAQDAWLEEMARILKPAGLFVTTTHGGFAMQSCTPDELHQLESKGIAFRVDRKGRFKLDGLPDFYQTTFHSQAYIQRRWGAFFDVHDYIEGGLAGHQDIIVMGHKNHSAKHGWQELHLRREPGGSSVITRQ
jgi:SAM-dependent methyltransferase